MTDPTVPPIPPPAPQYSGPPPAGTPSGNRTLMIVLAYLGILAVVPLVVEKDDREVQWHAKHGIVLLIAEVVLFVALSLLQFVIGSVLGPVACLTGLLVPLAMIGILVLHVLCIVKGVNGQRLIIPGVSQYADRF